MFNFDVKNHPTVSRLTCLHICVRSDGLAGVCTNSRGEGVTNRLCRYFFFPFRSSHSTHSYGLEHFAYYTNCTSRTSSYLYPSTITSTSRYIVIIVCFILLSSNHQLIIMYVSVENIIKLCAIITLHYSSHSSPFHTNSISVTVLINLSISFTE